MCECVLGCLYVCVCRKALLVFALRLVSYAKPFLIRGHVGCGMWQAKCGMRHAAQKEAAQVSARTVLKFTLEWSFCRCKQNVVVLAAVVPFMGLSQGLGLGLGLARFCVGSRFLVLVLGPHRCLIALLINFFAKRLQPLQLQLLLPPTSLPSLLLLLLLQFSAAVANCWHFIPFTFASSLTKANKSRMRP